MPFMVTQASSVMMSSPSPTNGAQDLHENFLCIGDAAFPGLSNQNELNSYLPDAKVMIPQNVCHSCYWQCVSWEPGRCRAKTTYHPGGQTELPKLPPQWHHTTCHAKSFQA